MKTAQPVLNRSYDNIHPDDAASRKLYIAAQNNAGINKEWAKDKDLYYKDTLLHKTAKKAAKLSRNDLTEPDREPIPGLYQQHLIRYGKHGHITPGNYVITSVVGGYIEPTKRPKDGSLSKYQESKLTPDKTNFPAFTQSEKATSCTELVMLTPKELPTSLQKYFIHPKSGNITLWEKLKYPELKNNVDLFDWDTAARLLGARDLVTHAMLFNMAISRGTARITDINKSLIAGILHVIEKISQSDTEENFPLSRVEVLRMFVEDTYDIFDVITPSELVEKGIQAKTGDRLWDSLLNLYTRRKENPKPVYVWTEKGIFNTYNNVCVAASKMGTSIASMRNSIKAGTPIGYKRRYYATRDDIAPAALSRQVRSLNARIRFFESVTATAVTKGFITKLGRDMYKASIIEGLDIPEIAETFGVSEYRVVKTLNATSEALNGLNAQDGHMENIPVRPISTTGPVVYEYEVPLMAPHKEVEIPTL